MRQFSTSVLERRKEFAGVVETPPYEGGWASEAIFFVRVEGIDDGARLDLRVEISPDGMHWMDEGTALEPLTGEGDAFVKVSHFGGWLRLTGKVRGASEADAASATLTIHLALKE